MSSTPPARKRSSSLRLVTGSSSSKKTEHPNAASLTIFEDFLLEDPSAFKTLIGTNGYNADVAVALANMCYRHRLGGAFLRNKIIPFEVEATANPNLILRSDSFCIKVLTEYAKLSGWKYFRKALKPIIHKIIRKDLNCEVDPHRFDQTKRTSLEESSGAQLAGLKQSQSSPSLINMGQTYFILRKKSKSEALLNEALEKQLTESAGDSDSGSDHEGSQPTIEGNRGKLNAVVVSILFSIIERYKTNNIPLPMRQLFTALNSAYQEKFGDVGNTVVAGLIFLRLICPAIVSPHQWDLIPSDVTIRSSTQRSLILIAKVLQAVASQSLFDDDNSVMVHFNHTIMSHRKLVEDIFEGLVKPLSDRSMIHKEFGDPTERFDYTEVLYKQCCENCGVGSFFLEPVQDDTLRKTLSFVQESILLQQDVVNLSGLKIGPPQSVLLAEKFCKNEVVSEINLSQNCIKEGIYSLLPALIELNKLSKLDLRNNNFSEDELLYIIQTIQTNQPNMLVLIEEDIPVTSTVSGNFKTTSTTFSNWQQLMSEISKKPSGGGSRIGNSAVSSPKHRPRNTSIKALADSALSFFGKERKE